MTDRWQKFSSFSLRPAAVAELADYCDEFLVHGVDVEGKKLGVDETLIRILGDISPIPVTYAGGVRAMEDLELVKKRCWWPCRCEQLSSWKCARYIWRYITLR